MVTLHFHGNLVDLLPRRLAKRSVVSVDLQRETSVKDFIESLGIPHPEVEKILRNGIETGFDAPLLSGDCLEIFPISGASDFFAASLLHPEPLREFRFIADVNVGKLGVKLRQLGFDTLLSESLGDSQIAAIAGCQRRILLTRDRNLLKRKVVDFGHLVRAKEVVEQVVEVVILYGLHDKVKPYSRCLSCNGMLHSVPKQDVLHVLEPLTKKYYTSFHQCAGCGKVYWSGSHRDKMDSEIAAILAASSGNS